MKNALKHNCDELERLESIRASTGVMPSEAESSIVAGRVHMSIVRDCDFRKSLALGSLHKEEAPLTFVRSLIQRGNLKEAGELLVDLKGHSDSDKKILSLLTFEEMRIAFFESDWQKTILLGEEAVKLGPPPVTLLALSQLRANAYFELGLFKEATRDLEQVEALGVLFPHAASLLYAQMLSVRLAAREMGPESATRKLNQILDGKLELHRDDFDLFISYMRLRVDIKRVRGGSALLESLACYLLATVMGDKLYAGLAVLDMYCEFGPNPPMFLVQKVEKLSLEFVRIKNMLDEVKGVKPATVSGVCLQNQTKVSFVNSSHPLMRANFLETVVSDETFEDLGLLFLEKNILLQLTPKKLILLPPEGQAIVALQSLSQGPVSKEELFAAVWGTQKYVPHLHDTLISTLCHRLKKNYGIIIRAQGTMIMSEMEILCL